MQIKAEVNRKRKKKKKGEGEKREKRKAEREGEFRCVPLRQTRGRQVDRAPAGPDNGN